MESLWNLIFAQEPQQPEEASLNVQPARKKARTLQEEIDQTMQEHFQTMEEHFEQQQQERPAQPNFPLVPNPFSLDASIGQQPLLAAQQMAPSPIPSSPPQQQQQQTNAGISFPFNSVPQSVGVAQLPAPLLQQSNVPLSNHYQGQQQPIRSVSNEPTPEPDVSQPFAEESAKEKKRKRNAENARHARLRKKNLEVHLRLEYLALQRENEKLRGIVKTELADAAQQIIGDCCYKSRDDDASGGVAAGELYERMGHSDFEMIESLTKSKKSFCLTDPRLPDNPIVYASTAFIELTGYPREQVVGRNCRFLQGPDTDPEAVKEIHEAIDSGKDGAVCLLNYKADGTPFWNEFFVAPLRDRENRIVNYVGVQTQVTQKDEKAPAVKPDPGVSISEAETGGESTEESLTLTEKLAQMRRERRLCSKGGAEVDIVDWSELAEMLEADDIKPASTTSGIDSASLEQELESLTPSNELLTASAPGERLEKLYYDYYTQCPRDLITVTLRSELMDSLISSNGDTSDARFVSAFELLSKLFKNVATQDIARTDMVHGQWKAISHPTYHYGGKVGINSAGETVYTLGKMCFNMFKPSNLRVTVQNTMNSIEPVCQVDQAPNAVPWSLRRELALQGDPEWQPHATLKSYDIAAALTIEPGQFMASPGEVIPSPPRRLRATHVVKGFFLPDPNVPNRMTVWFTGGYLSPLLGESDGTLDDWVELFGAEHKRTWGEALGVLGAKLLLGADLPDGMKEDGTLAYALRRPYGGHGRGYVDIVYADNELLITKGQSGTIHVMIRSQEDDGKETTGASNEDVSG